MSITRWSKRLVLVVLEIRSKEYGISEARAACKRDEERLVDGFDSYPAVAVEKANPVRPAANGGCNEMLAKRGNCPRWSGKTLADLQQECGHDKQRLKP
jgi:hypothetical protein